MVKYNKANEPLRKAKQSANLIEDIMRSNEAKLKQAYEAKKRYDARDEELFKFGSELYDNGYNLDDFIGSIKTCIESGYKTAEQIEATGWFLYDNIEHVPSFEKLAKLVNDFNLINAVKNGYNVSYRKALANEIKNKNSMGR